MKSHSNARVNITGMNVITRNIEIVLYDVCKCVVGLLVEIVAAPACESRELLTGEVIG